MTNTINTFPEPDTKCSRIELKVSIDFCNQPFTAPSEWDMPHLLTSVVSWYDDGKVDLDAHVISHCPWVQLAPHVINLRDADGRPFSIYVDEDRIADYRSHCSSNDRTPSQRGLTRWALENYAQMTLELIPPGKIFD